MSLKNTHEFFQKHEWVRYTKRKIHQVTDPEARDKILFYLERHKRDELLFCKTCHDVCLVYDLLGPKTSGDWDMYRLHQIAQAMTVPLKQPLDYKSIGRSLLKCESLPLETLILDIES